MSANGARVLTWSRTNVFSSHADVFFKEASWRIHANNVWKPTRDTHCVFGKSIFIAQTSRNSSFQRARPCSLSTDQPCPAISFMTDTQLTASSHLLDMLTESSLQQCQHDTGQNYVFLSLKRKNFSEFKAIFSLAILLHNTFKNTDYDANALLNVVMQRVQNLVYVDSEMWQRVVNDFKMHCASQWQLQCFDKLEHFCRCIKVEWLA